MSAMYGGQYRLAAGSYFAGIVLLAMRTMFHVRAQHQEAGAGAYIVIFVIAGVVFAGLLWLVHHTSQTQGHQTDVLSGAALLSWGYALAVWQWPWRWIVPTAFIAFVLAAIVNVKRERQRQPLTGEPDSDPEVERLLGIAKNDKDRIMSLVRIPWIRYQPYFDEKEPYINFVFSIFNNSLYDIVIDNSIKGDIWCDSSERSFYYKPKIDSHRPIVCGSRSGTNFLVQHPLTAEEVSSRFKGRDNVVIWFDSLQITFAGTAQFPEIGSTQLDTRSFCLRTKEGVWRNPNDKDEFAFLYTDEQWALLASPNTREVVTQVGDDSKGERKWLCDIADTQRDSIADYLRAECWIMDSYLSQESPLIDFRFVFRSSCVYMLSVASVRGSIRFGSRRLTKSLTITHNEVQSLAIGQNGWLTITQPLSPDDAAYILNNRNQEFYVDDFSVQLESSPKIAEALTVKLSPIVDKAAFWAKYPSLKIEIKTAIYAFMVDTDFDSTEPEPVYVTLDIVINNPRAEDVRIETARLATAVAGRRVVSSPETGEIYEDRFTVHGKPRVNGRRLKNLNNFPLIIAGDSKMSGQFQFVLEDVTVLEMQETASTLTLTDSFGEQHSEKCVAVFKRLG